MKINNEINESFFIPFLFLVFSSYSNPIEIFALKNLIFIR